MNEQTKYVIDGKFLTEKITGIQRYAIEITRELDKMASDLDIEIVVPLNCEIDSSQYCNIKVVYFGKRTGDMWEQLDLPRYLKKCHAIGIHLCNVVPILYPKGIACIHDISYKVNPQFFTNRHGRMSRLWHMLQYYIITKKARHIITVSEFSKNEIIKYYNVEHKQISVIYNAWQHFVRRLPDENCFSKFSMLEKHKYYFSMSSLAVNKNLKWVVEVARRNPNETFAVAGMLDEQRLGEAFDVSELHNIYYLGYVSDDEAKILMKYCKAFLFPTLYEGFGIPPLEAMSMGADCIISNRTCLPEIYGNSVYYIDPKDYEVDVIQLTEGEKAKNEIALEKYSWEDSAMKLRDILGG